MKYTLTLLALSIFLQGCASLSKKKIQNQKSLSSENFFKFNGLYSNTSVDSTKYYNPILWRFFEKKSKYINNWDSTFTEAKFITSKKISLVLYSKKLSVLKSIIVKGKIKEGCFYVRNKFMIYPLPPLILGYDNKKTRICFSKEYLQIDYHNLGFAISIFGAAGDNLKKSVRYNEIKTPKEKY